MPRKVVQSATVPTTKAGLLEKFKGYPELEVWERKVADPSDPGSLPIYLKDDPRPSCGDLGHALKSPAGAEKCRFCTGKPPFRVWYVRWINAGEQGRWSTVKERGYIKVAVKDLKDADEVSGMSDAGPDTVVTRGDRGGEILAKMPFYYYVERKREQNKRYNAKRTPASIKASVVAAAEGELGDEGAQSLHDHLKVDEYKQHSGRTLAEELGAE